MTKLKWVVLQDESLSSQGRLHPLTEKKVHHYYNVQQFPFVLREVGNSGSRKSISG